MRHNVSKNRRALTSAAVVLAIALSFAISPAEEVNLNYQGLLDTIAKGESRGNYNAYFGNASNSSTKFTQMTVGQVLSWQKNYVKQGSKSSAVGKYQFIRPTLDRLVKELSLDKNAKFDEKLQDRLAVALLQRRGVKDYAEGKIGLQRFAHNLSKEWAALPKVVGEEPHKSYYEGDGLNYARLSVEEIYRGIASLELAKPHE